MAKKWKLREIAPTDAWGRKLRRFVGAETDRCREMSGGWGGEITIFFVGLLPDGVMDFEQAAEAVGWDRDKFVATYGLVEFEVSPKARAEALRDRHLDPEDASFSPAKGYVPLDEIEVTGA